MQRRSVLIPGFLALAAGLLARTALADVVLLEGNDVPLTGRIVGEDETSIRFRIQGLRDSSYIVIEKSRIRRFWREENTYWDHLKGEEERKEVAERLDLEEKPAPPPRARPEPAEPPPPPRRGRTDAEIRRDIIDRTAKRVEKLLPHDPRLRVLAWLAAFGAASLLFYIGGKVADLSKLGLGRSAILALVTQFFLLLGALAYRSAREPVTFPLVVAGLVVAWVLTSRMLAGDRYSKSVLLLSFSLSFLLVLAGSFLAVMTVL